jgi:Putative Ig domain
VGAPTSYTISPSVPAGLNFAPSTGVISGTPTAITTQANYTVTATNAGGSTSATVAIVVGKAMSVLIDLGHADQITQVFADSTHMLTQDLIGQWAFWDIASDTKLVRGDQQFHGPVGAHQSVFQWPLSLAGSTFAVGVPNGVEVYSSVDGHLLSIIASTMIDSIFRTTWWKLASDGSYLCAGSPDGVSVWTPSGKLLFTRQGDYSAANAFAAPGQIQIALGPAGQTVIETISISTAASTISPSFTGIFNTWFTDGTKFLTNVANTVTAYSSQGAQLGIVALPGVTSLTGQGNWIWSIAGGELSIYSVGNSSPTATFPAGIAIPSGTTIGISNGTVVDLSGTTPTLTTYSFGGFGVLTAYAAVSDSQSIGGNLNGTLMEGARVSDSSHPPRQLSIGAAVSIAGGIGRTAIATAIGTIYYFDPSVSTPTGTISFSASKIALSTDGTVLAAFTGPSTSTINIYSLPGGNLANSIVYPGGDYLPRVEDFSLSGSGTMIGQLLYTVTPKTNFVTRQVGPTTGGPAIWSDSPFGISFNEAIQLSPDGTLIAVATAPRGSGTGSNIYKNGNLVAAAPGWVVGWIDNDHFLVNSYAPGTNNFSAASIYDSTGALTSTTTLPELQHLLPVTSSSVYSPDLNTIFSLSTGAATWTTINKSRAVGAVAGSYVVFASDTRVLVDTY